MAKDFSLTEDNKTFILANYTKMSLKELAQTIGNDPKQNGQTVLGRAIREFLSAKGLEYETTKFVKQGELVLTKEQIEFLDKNKGSMKPLEMAKLLFSDIEIEPLGREFRAVYKYVEESAPTYIPKEERLADEYKSPTSHARLVPRVNEYVKKGKINEGEKYLNIDKLSPQEIKYLDALLGYMNVYRFVYQMNAYKKKIDRELAESTFIRFCWGKDSLQEEEVDQYISLMEATVESAKLQRLSEDLEQQVTECLENKQLKMTIIEALGDIRMAKKEVEVRIAKLNAALNTSRAERLKKKIERTAAFINFFELWQQEKSRKPTILLAQKRSEAIKEEVQRLSSMDALIAEIYGVDEDTIAQ